MQTKIQRLFFSYITNDKFDFLKVLRDVVKNNIIK